ncbi:spermidine synthase [Saccharibacillus sp. JS10]|uniref:spermidine synthase n=1 Tax=Saccharibacillus sp. JS10 TaxID=2950552 RepID=UPI00210E906F|nr:fused MFS/spermidine synthase [Saccharibacillus sp. JS10]MCQ4086377.1 fused MFS/spermidine synthase [Saccharibacillus sp. JS10]
MNLRNEIQASIEEYGSTIKVIDTNLLDEEKGRFRVLSFADDDIQGVIDLDDPKRIVLEYPRAIIHLMEQNSPDFERAFIIGHGIGTIAGYFGDRDMRTAEISPTIAQWSRTYFGYDGAEVQVGDGRELLEQEPDGSLDCIVLDAFTEKGTPWHLFTSEFWNLAKKKMNERGIILLNVFGRGQRDSFVDAVWAGVSEVFEHTQAFALPPDDPRDTTNRILVGSKREVSFKLGQMAGFQISEPDIGTVLEDEMFGYAQK